MDPLTCSDLIDRGLANEAHCCSVCHNPEVIEAGRSKLNAVIIPSPDGTDILAEICCSQALSINSHEYVKDWTLPKAATA